jgi:tetratricopeptide (TPR) repeat protein
VLQLDRQSRLAKALTQYQRLRDSVAAREAKRALSRDERVLLRNCYFRIGDVYAAMEDWATAVDAYKAAANRYQFQPEALAAYVEMANAYNRMGRHADARGSVRQARWFLSQMDESAFSDPSFTKDAWTKRIQALSAGL